MAFNQTPSFIIPDQAINFDQDSLLPPPLGGHLQDLFVGADENGVDLNFPENTPLLYPNQQEVDPFFGSSTEAAQFQAAPFVSPPLSASQDFFTGIDENGVGLNFQENTQVYQNQQQVDPFFGSNNLAPIPFGFPLPSQIDILSSSVEVPQSLPLSFELERQTVEMQTYLQLQNQRLNAILQEETRQTSAVLQIYANNLMSLTQQKENELLIANQTILELQQRQATTKMELNECKNKSMENEAVVAKLRNNLREMQRKMTAGVPGASSTLGGETSNDMIESKCKVCHAENLCVVLLPCNHLCCCKSCELMVELCPICDSVKEGSMEIYLA